MSWTTTGLRPVLTGSELRVDQNVMDVLSASMYADAPLHGVDTAGSEQFFGGIVLDGQQSTEQHVHRPRKKAKTNRQASNSGNEGSDDAAKKQRGRPRIEPQDQTAVDRRRTQIRLAQRAYRNRKENTIANLKERNRDLLESIQRMQSTFSTICHNLAQHPDIAVKAGIATQVKNLSHEFERLVDFESMGDSGEDEDNTTIVKAKSKPNSEKAKPNPVQNSLTSDNPVVSSTADIPSSLVSLSDRNTRPLIKVGAGPLSWVEEENLVIDPSWSQPFNFGWDSSYSQGNSSINMGFTGFDSAWDVNGLSVERSFPQKKMYTYSFQETSFARRLHRMCLERAFQTLTNPKMDPAWVARTFRFTLFYTSKKRLRTNLQAILQRKAGESLENWEYPYFQVGGAGTHFPHRDAMGVPVYPPNLQNPTKAPGPWQLVGDEGEVAPDEVQKMLDEMGLDGIWFDAHDVEEYLKTKGIFLDGSASFVEIDTSMLSLPSEVTSLAGTGGRASMLATAPATPQSGNTDSLPMNTFEAQHRWPTKPQAGGNGLPSPDLVPSFEQVLQRDQGVVTFDVEKFLSRVVYGGSCLGRAPGFRKDTVDSALALAVQEAF